MLVVILKQVSWIHLRLCFLHARLCPSWDAFMLWPMLPLARRKLGLRSFTARLKPLLQPQDRLFKQLPRDRRHKIQQGKLPNQCDRVTNEPVAQPIAPAEERPSF